MSTFDSYAFEVDPRWQSIVSNLYISDTTADIDTILLKRKHKYYKQYIDPDYIIPDIKSNNTASTTNESNTNQQQQTESESNQSTSTSSTAASSTTASSVSDTVKQLFSSPAKLLQQFIPHAHTLLHVATLLFFVVYMIPIFGLQYSNQSFYRVLELCMLTSTIHTLRKYGIPQFNLAYIRRIGTDEYMQLILYCIIIYFITPPASICAAPIIIRSTIFVTKYTKRILPTHSPVLYGRTQSYIDYILQRETQMKSTIASFEVFIGVLLIINLAITPNKQFFITFIYWNIYLKTKYNINSQTKHAFTAFKLQIDSLINYKYVPIVVRQPLQSIWNTVCAFLYRQADMTPATNTTQRTGIINSIASKCTIM